jgi:hypothetical protein
MCCFGDNVDEEVNINGDSTRSSMRTKLLTYDVTHLVILEVIFLVKEPESTVPVMYCIPDRENLYGVRLVDVITELLEKGVNDRHFEYFENLGSKTHDSATYQTYDELLHLLSKNILGLD